jgi:hypothetical protein
VKILREGTLGQCQQQGRVLIDPGSMLISDGSLCKDEFIRFRPVCFCDIPEQHLERHIGIYGRFGLAFKKDFLVVQGANPVFYAAKGSVACMERPPVPQLTEEDLEADEQAARKRYFAGRDAEPVPVRRCEFFDRLVANLMKALIAPRLAGAPAEADDPVRELLIEVLPDLFRHVFAFTKVFDESLPAEDRDNFYMEREWRVAGFVRFELRDVQRVHVAPGFQDRIEREFPGLSIEELRFPQLPI